MRRRSALRPKEHEEQELSGTYKPPIMRRGLRLRFPGDRSIALWFLGGRRARQLPTDSGQCRLCDRIHVVNFLARAGGMNIHHHVATIQQVNIDECWAAATAMAMRRHSVAGTNHVKSLANAAGVPLDSGTLPDSSVQLLARAVGLGWHDFQTREVTLPELARLLLRGPVVAFGFFNYPGRPDCPQARRGDLRLGRRRNRQTHDCKAYRPRGDGESVHGRLGGFHRVRCRHHLSAVVLICQCAASILRIGAIFLLARPRRRAATTTWLG